LDDTILRVLSTGEDLAKDAHAKEESAPKLEEKHLEKVFVLKAKATEARLIGTEKGWFTDDEMPHDDAYVGSDYLEANDH
jgi:hypothetical protein